MTRRRRQIVSNVVDDETALENAHTNVGETNQQMKLNKNSDNHNISEGKETTWEQIPGQRSGTLVDVRG